jgi:hypothetical protein
MVVKRTRLANSNWLLKFSEGQRGIMEKRMKADLCPSAAVRVKEEETVWCCNQNNSAGAEHPL